ncbi:MAG: hypothetical protein ACJ78Q_08960 [Chloroflexia bacterium]
MTSEVTSISLDRARREGRLRRLLIAWAGHHLSLYNVTTGLVIALSLLLTILPYLVFKPYFPFGGDLQHPVNLAYLLANGFPLPVPATLGEQYPDTFAYLGASVASILGIDPTVTLILLPSAIMLASIGALYYYARRLYGQYTALFTVVAYGLLSFQPRQTYLDGTFIELLAGLVLVPLFLLALINSVSSTGWRWPCLAGILAGTIARYHFLGLTQALAITALFFIALLLFRRDLLNRALLWRLLLMAGIAAIISLPYSFYYARIYATILLGRVGILPPAMQEAVFPIVQFPNEFMNRLGSVFSLLTFVAFAALFVRLLARRLATRREPLPPADLLLVAWTLAMLVGTFTQVFLVPERFLRNLALPAALAVGLLLDSLRSRRLALVAALAILLAVGVPQVVRHTVAVAATSIYGEPADVPSLQALQRIHAGEPDRYVLADESGRWTLYYVQGRGYLMQGGPEGFERFGEPDRTLMNDLWQAYRDPCAPRSLESFRRYGVGYIYLGRRPGHWTLPGYLYNSGSNYASCSHLKLEYAEQTPSGRISIWRIQDAASKLQPTNSGSPGLMR